MKRKIILWAGIALLVVMAGGGGGGDGDLWGGMGMYGDSGHSVASRSIMTFMHSSRWLSMQS